MKFEKTSFEIVNINVKDIMTASDDGINTPTNYWSNSGANVPGINTPINKWGN